MTSYRRTNDASGQEIEGSTAGATEGRDHEYGYHDLERDALGFVLESETWPVFLAWANSNAVSESARTWLAANPNLRRHRREWLEHSPDPYIRAHACEVQD